MVSVAAAASGIAMAPCLLILVLAPTGTVIAYEVRGYKDYEVLTDANGLDHTVEVQHLGTHASRRSLQNSGAARPAHDLRLQERREAVSAGRRPAACWLI